MTALSGLFRGDAADLIPGTLRGYRTWKINPVGRLYSTGVGHRWPAPGTQADALCLAATGHPAPQADCTCGLYGWYAPQDSRIVPADVFGVVAAHGRLVLGTHGFRAEHAQVVAVTAPEAWQREALRAAGWTVYDTRADLIAAYPPDDLTGLVDHVCHCDPMSSLHGIPGIAESVVRLLAALTLKALGAAYDITVALATPTPDGTESP